MRTRIIKIDAGDRKIGLTTRDVEPLTEEERVQYAGAVEVDEHSGGSNDSTPQQS
jgi:hypothetical protein